MEEGVKYIEEKRKSVLHDAINGSPLVVGLELVFSRKNTKHKQGGVDMMVVLQIKDDPIEEMREVVGIIGMDDCFEALAELRPEEGRELRQKEEDVIPKELFMVEGDFGPILGDQVLEMDGGNLSNGHIAVAAVDDDLEEANGMLWGLLHLIQPLLRALPFIGLGTQSSL